MTMHTINLRTAVTEAIREALNRYPESFLAGEDIGIMGGAQGASKGLLAEFGPKRVIDTPISEAAISGLGVGSAILGMRPIIEIMYMDFISVCFDELVNQAAKGNCDAAQLCAQAMCLEEMLCCRIEQGALFYGQTHRRLSVAYTPELRNIVISSFAEMHDLFRQGRTPRARPSKACNACSLKDVCIPACDRASSVQSYLHAHMGEST